MKNITSIAVGFAVALAGGSVARAQPFGDGRPPRPPRIEQIVRDHAAEIGLDAATVRAVEDTVAAAVPELEALYRALEDAVAVGAADEAREAERALRERERELIESIIAMLTPEQWDALRRFLPPPPPPPPPFGPPGGAY